MPSTLGALPRRFKQTRLLIVGLGDVGARVVKFLPKHIRVLATTSSAARLDELRGLNITPLQANLDAPASLHRLVSLAPRVLQLSPPPSAGAVDSRTRNLVQSLRRGSTLRAVYASTTGVYGDCEGEWVDETRAVNPQTDRAKRRVDAEYTWRKFGQQSGVSVSSLRIPGIYAVDRIGGDPLDRVRSGAPNLVLEDDGYTNHIHADALAKACIQALWRGKPMRNFNVAEDCELKTGDYYDQLADAAGLPRQRRITWDEAQKTLSPMRLSFLNESRRIDNARMKTELQRELHRTSFTATSAPAK